MTTDLQFNIGVLFLHWMISSILLFSKSFSLVKARGFKSLQLYNGFMVLFLWYMQGA